MKFGLERNNNLCLLCAAPQTVRLAGKETADGGEVFIRTSQYLKGIPVDEFIGHHGMFAAAQA